MHVINRIIGMYVVLLVLLVHFNICVMYLFKYIFCPKYVHHWVVGRIYYDGGVLDCGVDKKST